MIPTITSFGVIWRVWRANKVTEKLGLAPWWAAEFGSGRRRVILGRDS
jgi:hypothetical protein